MSGLSIVSVLSISLITFCCADSNTTTPVSQLTDCAGNEGQEKKVINGWAACHNGRYVMIACQADDGSRVDIGMTVRQRGFVFECAQTSTAGESPIAVKAVACLRQKDKPENALVVEPGQRVRDAPFVYECVRILSGDPNANSLTLKAVACSNSTSDIPDGGTVTLGAFTYECSRQSGSLTNTIREVFLKAKGCIYQGKEYPLDQQVIVGNFAFKCKSTDGWPTALEFAIVGCAYGGRRYDENEKYIVQRGNSTDSFVMQCRRKNNAWSEVPVGCVQSGNPPISHDIGDTWIDDGGPGDARLKYVMLCKGDITSVQAITSQCIFQPNVNDPSTAATIKPGCMKKFSKPNALVKCIKGAGPYDGVSSEVLQRLSLTKVEQDALAAGFQYC